jgi:hypothetical protein
MSASKSSRARGMAITLNARKAEAVLARCPACGRLGPKARLAEHLRVDHGR